ncbi:MAG: tyrosine decarboxylase MfnA [Methanotrichaceae archaeon]|nr:tyrosine decarboxylase MfnA [Methanotrichaceae archaeon]
MKEKGLSEDEVLHLLADVRSKDYSYDRFFSTMCTRPHIIAVKAHEMFLETNLGDPGLFSGASELEQTSIQMMGELLHCPNAYGYISTGGTESNIQGIRAARNTSNIRNGNIVVPKSAHFSFDKIADMLCLEVRQAELDNDLKVDLASVESLIDQKTVALVGIAGTTEFGQVDPIEDLAKVASEKDIHLHVDGAFGGFVLPFLEGDWKWDFLVPGVSSITIDPHKMGLSTIPAGGLLFREAKKLAALETETHYLTKSKQVSLTGTRSGAAAAATYAIMILLGREGFRNLVKHCMDLTGYLVKSASEIDLHPVIQPVMNVVALKVASPIRVKEELAKRNWHVSTTREPQRALRLILMPHVTFKSIDLFLDDLEAILYS